MKYKNVPKCCKSCKFLDEEPIDYCPSVYSCSKNIFLPIKKKTCEKQKLTPPKEDK